MWNVCFFVSFACLFSCTNRNSRDIFLIVSSLAPPETRFTVMTLKKDLYQSSKLMVKNAVFIVKISLIYPNSSLTIKHFTWTWILSFSLFFAKMTSMVVILSAILVRKKNPKMDGTFLVFLYCLLTKEKDMENFLSQWAMSFPWLKIRWELLKDLFLILEESVIYLGGLSA